ncbi:MAG: gluconeogenesis factor YvcK family protein [Thermodesulfobacteriota bacterium]
MDKSPLPKSLAKALDSRFQPLDLLPGRDRLEKFIELLLSGVPHCPRAMAGVLAQARQELDATPTAQVKVVVFGGGSGLSNILGGDSRQSGWAENPFAGLKEIFPKTKAVVCVTDDGGSTGELLKDLDLISLGDLRHVLLSSIQGERLARLYELGPDQAREVASFLYTLFNYRYQQVPASADEILKGCGYKPEVLPISLAAVISDLLDLLFTVPALARARKRPHCLGNLLLAAAIYKKRKTAEEVPGELAVMAGLDWLGQMIGAAPKAVLPSTVTPAHLKILYANGVLVAGEHKSAEAHRSTPIHQVFVEFADRPVVPAETLNAIGTADIIIFAPGSLYTSITPILQVPGIAEAVRQNKNSLKILVANLWIQKGETDLVWDSPHRRFYVSDLIKAYNRNIPGGVQGLFSQVLLLGMRDIPGSILQSYAVEDKMPIYLDRGEVWNLGFKPLEAKIFSRDLLRQGKVQHGPGALAQAVKAIWGLQELAGATTGPALPPLYAAGEPLIVQPPESPAQRFKRLRQKLPLEMPAAVRTAFTELLWRHWDIKAAHLDNISGVALVPQSDWHRCQQWDRVHSFYDPDDGLIKIREDAFFDDHHQEMSLLVPLGQALLGNYVESREMEDVLVAGRVAGKLYRIKLRSEAERNTFFSPTELDDYLQMVRMIPADDQRQVYTRLINGNEGFTPPGLLMGLFYAWYLDNRHAAHIEYKMAISRLPVSSLVPEQLKMMGRREMMVSFFRQVVFHHQAGQ